MVGFVGVGMDPYDQDGCQQIPPKLDDAVKKGRDLVKNVLFA